MRVNTHLLETINSNTTPTSTNMCHKGGEIDQDALLKTELLKMKDMVLQLEKHCISLEIQIQQKEESFQSNKPCKNRFANAALKNELRKIKGNSVDTKFAKASILGKPSLENTALKNELRKIKGNSVDTKFAKASILGKPSLQPSRKVNQQSVGLRNTSERPRISRPRFASQVDEKNDLSKSVAKRGVVWILLVCQEKTTDQEDLSKSRKLCWRKNKRH
ncbi:hypothetical protein Tco_0049382 [Tanacetum coccineum]